MAASVEYNCPCIAQDVWAIFLYPASDFSWEPSNYFTPRAAQSHDTWRAIVGHVFHNRATRVKQ